MNDYKRLSELEEIIDLLYEKLSIFQKELITSSSPLIQFELKQRIQKEIIPNIRSYEAEYWRNYPEEEINLSEDESKTQLVRIESAITSLSNINKSELPPQMISLLQNLQMKLTEDKIVSAKLKLAIPIIPMIVSYELEIETEGYMYKTWMTLKRLIRRK